MTTRANLQVRDVEPKNAVALTEHIQGIGLCSRRAGADNIRNVTGTPTAGVDPQELIDTRPCARDWHFHILNDRTRYGIRLTVWQNFLISGCGTITSQRPHRDRRPRPVDHGERAARRPRRLHGQCRL